MMTNEQIEQLRKDFFKAMGDFSDKVSQGLKNLKTKLPSPPFSVGDWVEGSGSKSVYYVLGVNAKNNELHLLDSKRGNHYRDRGWTKSFPKITLTLDHLPKCHSCGRTLTLVDIRRDGVDVVYLNCHASCIRFEEFPTIHEAVESVLLVSMWKAWFKKYAECR